MTRKAWFVEVPRMGGGWAPQIHYGDQPTGRGSEGEVKRFRAKPVEIRPEHHGLSLAELQEIYRPDILEPIPEPDIDLEQAIINELEPVLDWYQPDELPPRGTVVVLRDVVADLQADRAEVIKLRCLLLEFAKQKLGSEMEYPMNADWQGGFETMVLKARRLIGTEGG